MRFGSKKEWCLTPTMSGVVDSTVVSSVVDAENTGGRGGLAQQAH